MPSAAATHAASSSDPADPFGALPARPLDRAELAGLARAVAARRDLWQRHVLHGAGERHCAQLYRDRHVDVWLLCWTNQQETGLHDHDVSSGAVEVVEGNLVEDRLELEDNGLREASTPRSQGSAFDFGPSRIHRVRHPHGEPPAISIHAYSPPLSRMGYYDTDPFGAFRRTSVSYTEELSAAPVARLMSRQAIPEAREVSRSALEQIVKALGYPAEWAVELERRQFEAGRLWRNTGEVS